MNATLMKSRPLAPLARRRWAVLLVVGGFFIMLLGHLLRGQANVSNWVWGPLSLGGMVLAFASWCQLVMPSNLGIPRLKDASLDERQRQQLVNAYALAYRILAIVLTLASVYAMFAGLGESLSTPRSLPLPHDSYDWTALLLGLILVAGGLPAAILAWTEPDAGLLEE